MRLYWTWDLSILVLGKAECEELEEFAEDKWLGPGENDGGIGLICLLDFEFERLLFALASCCCWMLRDVEGEEDEDEDAEEGLSKVEVMLLLLLLDLMSNLTGILSWFFDFGKAEGEKSWTKEGSLLFKDWKKLSALAVAFDEDASRVGLFESMEDWKDITFGEVKQPVQREKRR